MIRSRSSFVQRYPLSVTVSALLNTSIALSVVSCSPGADPPEVRLNPSPQLRYAITLTIEDPPAPVKIQGQVQFFIENEECMPYADRIAGIKPDSTFRVPLVFAQETATTFVSRFFADAPMPENYYGLGECHWDFTSAKVLIHILDVEQSVDISRNLVLAQGTQISLCRRPDTGVVADMCFRTDTEPTPQILKQTYIVSLKASKD